MIFVPVIFHESMGFLGIESDIQDLELFEVNTFDFDSTKNILEMENNVHNQLLEFLINCFISFKRRDNVNVFVL